MLTDLKLESLFIELSLPEETRNLIRTIRASSPVRELNTRLGNCEVWYFSRKMGNKHLKLESRTVEAAQACLYEFDDEVLEYWPQPHRMSLSFRHATGEIKTKNVHTPDFLVIRKNSISFEECREESRLLKASRESSQYYKDTDGNWHYQPAEDYVKPYQLNHRVISSMHIPHRLVDNLRFLADYFQPNSPPLPTAVEKELIDVFQTDACIPFQELISNQGFSADVILKAITKQIVYVDLNYERLDLSDEVMVYRDSVVSRAARLLTRVENPPLPIPGMGRLKAGTTVQFDSRNYTVELVGGNQVLLRDIDGSRTSISLKDIEDLYGKGIVLFENKEIESDFTVTLAELSKEQLDEAVRRLEAITGDTRIEVSDRTKYRWAEKIKTATNNVEKLKLLAPNHKKRGNYSTRLDEKTERLAVEAIKQHYNNPTCRTILGAYDKYIEMCDQNNCVPMSYVTFCKRVKEQKSIRKREGGRKDYQEKPIPLYLDYRHPLHGLYPHDVCYIDHTVLTLATCSTNGADLGKPWFTFAIDGHTTRSRAMFVGYDPPSARVILMTLRDYVRRNGRLPKVLVVDGGKEFKSVELELFCKLYEIDLRHRPPGRPRGGASVERAMGYTETEFIAQLEGNTRIMRNVRMVTQSVEPFQFRRWTLTALWGALDEFLFNIRDNRTHPTFGVSPRTYEEKRTIETGIRENTFVRFDEDILLLTCPHPKNRFRVVDRTRGVWADNMYYWHDDFHSAKSKEKVEVRTEPWNANVVYVYFHNQWVAAIARDLRTFGRRTRYEVELALRAERRIAKIAGNRARTGKVNAAQMVGLWEPSRFDPRISSQQGEMASLYEGIGMGAARKTTQPNVLASTPLPEVQYQEISVEAVPIQIKQAEHGQVSEAASEITTQASLTPLEATEQELEIWKDIDDYI